MRRALYLLPLLVLLAVGCSGGSSQPTVPVILPAKTFHLEGFKPSGTVHPGRPTTVAFTIEQPSGQPLTKYKTGPGPHTGIHLIIVRDDLATIIHRHPKPAADGRVRQAIDFPTDGHYYVLVDAYPRSLARLPNFQLHHRIDVGASNPVRPIPPFRQTQEVDGYRVSLGTRPRLRAIQAGRFEVTVRDAQGRPVHFHPWYGALAHAIFFQKGSLAYFHTHVCGASTPGCTSILGNPRLASNETRPGQLNIGVLLPAPGTWRLFLQVKPGDRVITAPFTLRVR